MLPADSVPLRISAVPPTPGSALPASTVMLMLPAATMFANALSRTKSSPADRITLPAVDCTVLAEDREIVAARRRVAGAERQIAGRAHTAGTVSGLVVLIVVVVPVFWLKVRA